ncbi:MAG: DEAD/DEAH box helicase [Gaiellales bacterium]|nr:DEAD/DEAH box helicase [Gaiellales bacterium]
MRQPLFEILSNTRFPEVEAEIMLPAREGRSRGLPDNMHPHLEAKLRSQGVESLWVHQREAWEVAQRRESFIVTTGTASGKSLCFNLPVLDTLLRHGRLRALYLYPTKALAQDQLRRLQELAQGAMEVAVYDGDTPSQARRLARDRARILLTNPDMISMAILPHHERWSEFFYNLAFVVIDEAHTYRGVFGSHVANVLRRLRRVAGFYGADPLFFMASATILNAVEHARNLTGLEVTPVSDDAAPSGRRKIVLWQPPLLDTASNLRRGNTTDAAVVLAELLVNGVRTICFTKSRRSAEVVYQSTVHLLKERAPQIADRLSPYRAGYTPEQRRGIEKRLFSAELLGVVATNALELGIDVGAIDAAMTVGYPGTVASLWQQWGRAGRGKSESLGLFLAGNDALEQFFIRHPHELLSRPVEAATIDFTNPFVHDRHLLAAAYESPLEAADTEYFGPGLGDAAQRLLADGRLARRTGSWVIRGASYPAADISLRSSSPDQFTIVEEDSGSIVGTLEAESAFSFLHPGAVYLHMGDSYLVTHLDIEPRVAVVRQFHGTYYTQPRRQSSIEILSQDVDSSFGPLRLYMGQLSVTNQVIGYQRKQVGSDEALGSEDLELPAQHFVTEGVWFTIALELVSQERDLPRLPGGLHALEHALIALLPLLAMCDRWDIGGLSTPVHAQTELPTIFIFDGHPGGVGIARQGFTQFARWLADARSLIRDCPCSRGCPSCIQSPKCGNLNEPLDKGLALDLLSAVLS